MCHKNYLKNKNSVVLILENMEYYNRSYEMYKNIDLIHACDIERFFDEII